MNGASEEPDMPVAINEAAKTIKAIDKTTVHRICSGQVVLTLATAVKELVENSIDAGATSVEVRLRDHGISLVEVSDNGRGVEEENFEGLTLKHHTSKIRDFGDLVGVKTFGFRGEALSSLCALSSLSVITRHTSEDVGTKLVYDHNGRLSSKTPMSRQVGTTVSLENLFSTLPVRHKEFQRNVKKEFAKMVQVLYSYCLISTGIRITCTNQTDKGKKTVVVSTSGHNSIKENISSVFGAKQVASLLEYKQENASNDVLTEYGMADVDISKGNCLFNIEGFISSCAHGQGRSTTDRQFYFINCRPCDPAKVMKLVNEVYHYYNRHQSPFVVLNIRLKEDDVDINVTPDKRQILVNNEKLMLATIKTSLIKLFENIPSTYRMQNTSLDISLNRSFGSPESIRISGNGSQKVSSNDSISSLVLKFGRNVSGSPASESYGNILSSPVASGLKRSHSQGEGCSSPSSKQPKLDSFFKSKSLPLESKSDPCSEVDCASPSNGVATDLQSKADDELQEDTNTHGPFVEGVEKLEDLDKCGIAFSGDTSNLPEDLQENEDSLCCRNTSNIESLRVLEESSNQDTSVSNGSDCKIQTKSYHTEDGDFCNVACSASNQNMSAFSGETEVSDPQIGNKIDAKNVLSQFYSTSLQSPSCKEANKAASDFLNNLLAKRSDKKKSITGNDDTGDMEISAYDAKTVTNEKYDNEFSEVNRLSPSPNKKIVVYEEYNPENYTSNRKSRTIRFNLESLKEKIKLSVETKEKKNLVRRFHAKIAPTDNQSAEDELKKEITKDMFAQMEILGQFNLGFIITRFGSDLFIVDQHATDEKYNFETLQQTCVLQNQRLIIPQLLELTAVNESILLDNIDIFEKNGFMFKIEENKCVGRRVSLTSMPFSRGWEFGKEDIDELIFMLSDSPGVMCRPSRVRAMFASRACRKSVMIGTALSTQQMRKLVDHMGEIEQPWNCPHGRPTMRHLINLDIISVVDDN
ncbi:mismatch repair endonuclease PMS2-like [Macrobrachium nipponense]|uniref:mismatch repair endonuclease PMS2-like n=1 Tax=Macrobrachium nipponense TaxID=159736 RepID=UPI0030C7C79F